METRFEQLIVSLSNPPLSADALHQINLILMQQTDQSLSSFVSQSFQSLLILQQWTWQLLSQDSLEWVKEPYYQELFYTLASFNKMLIFTTDKIEDNIKASLLISESVDQLNKIFKNIDQCVNDNNPYITFVSLWFDNHSYLLHNDPQHIASSVIDHIGEYFLRNYMMNKQYKFYLTQLRQPELAEEIFTGKMLLYIKTCSFYICNYLQAKNYEFCYTADEMVRYLGDDYLQIIHIHTNTVASWNSELLACIGHLVGLMNKYYWWSGQMKTQIKSIFPSEESACQHIQDLINIIACASIYKHIKTQPSNNETILLESSLIMLLHIARTENVNWFYRSHTKLQEVLLTVAEASLNEKICLCAYGVMGMVLSHEQLKQLKIVDNLGDFFFNIIEQAWHHPSKKYKNIPILNILQGFLNLSKNDCIQQGTAESNKIPLFIEMCDQYPLVYNILWALSFNQNIQEQLRSSSIFMSKLGHLSQECDSEEMRKVVHGILWNLEINHDEHPTSVVNDGITFDIMISYSHKDKIFCKQIYEELTKAGYRVWIDFDQMHGNVMDAMAQAIERSHIVIICMSEEYRNSNYCRAEAHYAFQRQRKIVPVLLQEHYRPDGWLLFLIGQVLYVDFTKYDFSPAMTMLFEELKSPKNAETKQTPVRLVSIPKASSASILPQNMLEWTSAHVQAWLTDHNLEQMACLLENCNGRSLVYLNKYIKTDSSVLILKLLQTDSLRRTGQDLSLIELSSFRALMDEQKQFISSTVSMRTKTNNDKKIS